MWKIKRPKHPRGKHPAFAKSLLLVSTVAILAFLTSCGTSGEFTDLNAPAKSEESVLSSPEQEPAEDEFSLEKEIFFDFIQNILQSDTIEYQRTITPAPSLNKESLDIMHPESAKIYEKRNTFLIALPQEEGIYQIISDGVESYWANTQDKLAVPILVRPTDAKDNLFALANLETLDPLSVGREPLNDKEYLCFSVAENSRLANWYFTEEGLLFLRTYQENEHSVAVEYSNLEFGQRDSSFFQLAGYQVAEALPEEFLLSLGLEAPAALDTAPEKEQASKDEADKPLVSEAPEKQPEPSKEESSLPAVPVQTKPQVPTAPQKKPQKTESSSASNADNPVEFIIDEPIEESSGKSSTQEDTTEVTLPDRYPIKSVPLPAALTLVSVDMQNRSGVWGFTLHGIYTSTSASARNFYEDLFKNSERYSVSDDFNTEKQYTFTRYSGTVDGHYVNVVIKESHITNQVTIDLYVE